MTITAGIDTYCTVAEANTYFATTFSATAWDALDDSVKEIALRQACLRMEQMNWLGIKQDSEQTLQFPRIYDNDNLNGTPEDVKHAQMELALYLYQNQSNQVLTAQQMGLKSISLGNESYSFGDGSVSANYIPCQNFNIYADRWVKKGFPLC